MSSGVPTMRSDHRAVRLRHYRIVINNRMLILIHARLVRPPPLIYKPYHLLLPRENGCRVSWPPLLCHRIVKYWPRGDVLCHIGAVAGDIPPNRIHPHVRYPLNNWGVLPVSVPIPMHPDRYPPHHPIMETAQHPHNLEGDNP